MGKINVFILAAGFGERLRPITYHIPKPLLPVLGMPVLETALKRIFTLPVGQIGINLHHKAEMIDEWLKASSYSGKVKIFLENPILGTGGALKNAEDMLRTSAFLVHNADILTDINLPALVEEHLSSGNIATLAVHDHKKFNNVLIDEKGEFKSVATHESEDQTGLRRIAFTGIAVYSPEFLGFLPEGKSSVVDAWLKAVSSGFKVGTVDFTGCLWSDIGTPASYYSVIFEALKREGETVYADPSVDCSRSDVDGFAVIEKGSIIEGAAFIRNCILLPGAMVSNGSRLENAIAGPDYVINIEDSVSMRPLPHFLPWLSSFFTDDSETLSMTLTGTGGSDRKYYRVGNKKKTAILMECPDTDPDYRRHIAYTQFFRKYAVPVPELLPLSASTLTKVFISKAPSPSPSPARGEGNILSPPLRGGDEGEGDACGFTNDLSNQGGSELHIALFEDLGDISLYSWLKCRKRRERIEYLYRRVMDILVRLHTTVTQNVSECPLLQSRIFDYEHLRWETDYFIERFVGGVVGVDIKNRKGLDGEFDRLAKEVDSFGKTIVHRDFQSQNIMVTEGDAPRLVDYQGARMGPPAYDVASVLWDPYFRLDDDMRDRLLDYYVEKMKGSADDNFDETRFRQTLLPCRLQRHMQALGAYGFLSKAKGRAYFLKHIPQALSYLNEEAGLVREEYPVLYGVLKAINEKI